LAEPPETAVALNYYEALNCPGPAAAELAWLRLRLSIIDIFILRTKYLVGFISTYDYCFPSFLGFIFSIKNKL